MRKSSCCCYREMAASEEEREQVLKRVGRDLPAGVRQSIVDKIPNISWAVDKRVDEDGLHVLHVDLCTTHSLYTEEDLAYAQLLSAWGFVDRVTFSTLYVTTGGGGGGDADVRHASFDNFRHFLRACHGLPFSIDSTHRAQHNNFLIQQQGALLTPAATACPNSELGSSWKLLVDNDQCMYSDDGWPLL